MKPQQKTTEERKAEQRERNITRTIETCQYFTGIQNKLCKAGVEIRTLVGGPDFGWATRLPCMLSHGERCEVTCDKRHFPTREEAEQQETEWKARLERTGRAIRGAHAHAKAAGLGKGSGGKGNLPCPTECGGTLYYSVASVNGHMHAKCSTRDCVSWME